MESPTGMIPEELLYREKKAEVISFLTRQPWPGDLKRRLLEGYAITVGIRIRSRDFQLVEASGYDGVNYGRNF
jgi:hypothetical protein